MFDVGEKVGFIADDFLLSTFKWQCFVDVKNSKVKRSVIVRNGEERFLVLTF